jgi:hypothetical protein
VRQPRWPRSKRPCESAGSWPDAFLPDLAMALQTLGLRLTEEERFADAMAHDRE